MEPVSKLKAIEDLQELIVIPETILLVALIVLRFPRRGQVLVHPESVWILWLMLSYLQQEAWKSLLLTSQGFLGRAGQAFKPIHLAWTKEGWVASGSGFIVGSRWGRGEDSCTGVGVFLVWTPSLTPREWVPRLSYWFSSCGTKGEEGKGAQNLSAVKYQKWS